MIGKQYTCEYCKKEFEAAWTDEEAAAEMKENFGDVAADDVAVVCDDCYKEMIAEYPPEQYNKDKQIV